MFLEQCDKFYKHRRLKYQQRLFASEKPEGDQQHQQQHDARACMGLVDAIKQSTEHGVDSNQRSEHDAGGCN